MDGRFSADPGGPSGAGGPVGEVASAPAKGASDGASGAEPQTEIFVAPASPAFPLAGGAPMTLAELAAGSPGGEQSGERSAGQGELRPMWPRPPQPESRRARGFARAARLTATLGAALFFFAAWTPWASAITSGDLRQGASGPSFHLGLTPAELGAPPLSGQTGGSFFAVWSGLTVAGLLLSPLLWRSRPRWTLWLPALLYACWIAGVSLVIGATAQAILVTIPAEVRTGAKPTILTLTPYAYSVAVYSISPAWGLWLAALAPVVALVAFALASAALVAGLAARRKARKTASAAPAQTGADAPSVQGEIVPSGAHEAPAPQPRRSLPGVGAVSGGLLLWAWGFFLLPWATVNCARGPLLISACQGLPVGSALQVGLGPTRDVFDPSAAPYAISGLLLVGALFILVGVWRRAISRALCAWASLWLLAALGCALLAIEGAQQVVRDAPSVGLPAGDWRGDTGVLVVYLALLLVAIGLIPLWARAVRRAGGPSATSA